MSKPLTKTQLLNRLSERTNLPKTTASGVLDEIAKIIHEEVAQGGAVTLPGLGKFSCQDRPERMVRNPATGEQFLKGADRRVRVTVAKALKDQVL